MTTLGIMSGTSVDGVDYALCQVTSRRIELLDHWHVRYPAALRRMIHQAASGRLGLRDFIRLHHDLGRFYARHAMRGKRRPQLAGLHGQTVFHSPGRDHSATFQAGESAYLARALGVPVVHNFRAADLAAGGEGAPLAPLFHVRVFARPRARVLVNNLGGISNVTSIDWTGPGQPVVTAFDTGPGNLPLNLAVSRFTGGRSQMDRNGARAKCGQVNEALVERWLSDDYLRKPPPKSTGREQFGEPFVDTALKQCRRFKRMTEDDILATLTEFTARSMVNACREFLRATPDTVVLAGGGACNPTLVLRIRQHLNAWSSDITLKSCADYGWPHQAIEPAAFALLAWRRYRRKHHPFPRATGAIGPVIHGQMTA